MSGDVARARWEGERVERKNSTQTSSPGGKIFFKIELITHRVNLEEDESSTTNFIHFMGAHLNDVYSCV